MRLHNCDSILRIGEINTTLSRTGHSRKGIILKNGVTLDVNFVQRPRKIVNHVNIVIEKSENPNVITMG
jgi:hypothetical protein